MEVFRYLQQIPSRKENKFFFEIQLDMDEAKKLLDGRSQKRMIDSLLQALRTELELEENEDE